MKQKKINVLQFICPVGFYGAERWILALINNADPERVRYDLAVLHESNKQDLEIVNQFNPANGESFKIPMRTRFDLSVIDRVCAVIKNREIDIVHTHGYKSDIIGVLAARKAGVKCVCTPHGFGKPNSFKLKIFIKMGIWALRYADKVVPLSGQLLDEVRGFGIAESKVAYIRNGVDLSEVEPFRQERTNCDNSSKKIIGFVGQLIPRKNIRDILDIFDEVCQEIPDAELQLLGDGESRQELERYSKSLKSAPNIRFLGFCHERMEYLKRFDLFVMTSKDEGIPRCLMEAMAMEVPVAAYDIRGIDQLVEHQKTGLLSSFGDKASLRDHWKLLLCDANLSRKLAQQGRIFVNDKFSGKRMASEYSDLFFQMMTNQKFIN